jgi:hypothetical protein
MTDKSDAERAAIKAVFPRAQLLLCRFHREQAWDRWARKNLPAVQHDTLKLNLRLIAESRTEEDLVLNLSTLRQSHIWIGSQGNMELAGKVKEYCEQEWFTKDTLHSWVSCFHQFHQAMETNNFVEAYHKTLKEFFLPMTPDTRVDSLIKLLIDDVFTSSKKRYITNQIHSCTAYRQRPDLPQFLLNRPSSICSDWKTRYEKGTDI